MATDDPDDSTILTISELIDNAFGDPEVNTVHHKHVQTVLYIMARQLRVLERRVAVQLAPYQVRTPRNSSVFSVTEVKLHAMTEHTKGESKTAISSKKGRQAIKGQKGKGGKSDMALTGKITSTSDESPTAKTSSDKMSTKKTTSYGASSDKASSNKYGTDKSSTVDKSSAGGKPSTADNDTSAADKSSRAGKKSSSDQTSSTGKKLTAGDTSTADDISTADKRSRSGKKQTAGQSSGEDDTATTDKTSKSGKKQTAGQPSAEDDTATADKRSRSGKKQAAGTSSDEDNTATADKTSRSGKKRTGGGQSSDDDDTVTADKTSRSGKKRTAGQSSDEDDTATADKTSKSGKKQAAGQLSGEDDTATGDTTSRSGKKQTADQKSGADGRTAGKKTTGSTPSSADRISVTDRTSLDRNLSEDKSGNLSKTKGRRTSATADARSMGSQEYQKLLDEVEEMRERELRVIRQRADSRDQPEKTPTPIASLNSLEATYEKLLVVERIPAEEAQARAARRRSTRDESLPRISVVTQEQFLELSSQVRQLEKKFAPIGTAELPENAQLMQELRKGASLTDAMAALQLSARLEATEKTLKNLLPLVTDLASQLPGYKPTQPDNVNVLFGASNEKEEQGRKSAFAKPSILQPQRELEIEVSRVDSVEVLAPVPSSRYDTSSIGTDIKKVDDFVTYDELEISLQNVYDSIMKMVADKSANSSANADVALKLVISLEKKIDISLDLGDKMEKLEKLVADYSEQINILDTGLSSQLTNYQEELTQMQHELETGLETMAEVLANAGGDATAVAELNAHFSDLQEDIDEAIQRQKELRKIQITYSMDLDGVRVQIEMLRETKADRDEVADALRDKAGLGDLNGLVSHQQFDAVRGDLEKRIASAYDKFNNQETIWQKAIDDLLRQLYEKADIVQVECLRDDINHHLEDLRQKIKFIADIVGEPTAAALSRKLGRDASCLSCSAPVHMKTEELTTPMLPALRPPTIGAEAQKPREDGDHGLCYPGYPVKHPIDPRAHICNRWCGGSHTLMTAANNRSPPGVIITPFNRKLGQQQGTDGKMYAVDEVVDKKPCSQCIPEPPTPPKQEEPSIVEPYDWPPITSALPSDVTPAPGDFQDRF